MSKDNSKTIPGTPAWEADKLRQEHELTANGHHLAETLWGIERYGRPHAPDPAPIYVTMAWQLQTDPELRAALHNALDDIDTEQGK